MDPRLPVEELPRFLSRAERAFITIPRAPHVEARNGIVVLFEAAADVLVNVAASNKQLLLLDLASKAATSLGFYYLKGRTIGNLALWLLLPACSVASMFSIAYVVRRTLPESTR